MQHLTRLAADATTPDELEDRIARSPARTGGVCLSRWVRKQRAAGRPDPMTDWQRTLDELPCWTWVDTPRRRTHAEMTCLRVAEALGAFDERERDIVARRVTSASPVDLTTLGHDHGVSHEAVRLVEQRILAKATHPAVVRLARVLHTLPGRVGRRLDEDETTALLADDAAALRLLVEEPVDAGALSSVLHRSPALTADILAAVRVREPLSR